MARAGARRAAAGAAARTPAPLPPATLPAPPGTAPGPRRADLGGGQCPCADPRHSTTRRSANHETDVDRQTRKGGDPRPGGGVPDAGEAPRASTQRLTPLASGASVDVDRHGRAATVEPGARECDHP